MTYYKGNELFLHHVIEMNKLNNPVIVVTNESANIDTYCYLRKDCYQIRASN